MLAFLKKSVTLFTLAWLLYMGFVGPFLMSSQSDAGVILGVILLFSLLYYTIHNLINYAKQTEEG